MDVTESQGFKPDRSPYLLTESATYFDYRVRVQYLHHVSGTRVTLFTEPVPSGPTLGVHAELRLVQSTNQRNSSAGFVYSFIPALPKKKDRTSQP
jgi:hypothetical protein